MDRTRSPKVNDRAYSPQYAWSFPLEHRRSDFYSNGLRCLVASGNIPAVVSRPQIHLGVYHVHQTLCSSFIPIDVAALWKLGLASVGRSPDSRSGAQAKAVCDRLGLSYRRPQLLASAERGCYPRRMTEVQISFGHTNCTAKGDLCATFERYPAVVNYCGL